jgi:ketosteroid isomerase-like protein
MVRADEFVTSSARQQTAVGFFASLMHKDFDRWRELLTEDVVQDNPYMPDLAGSPDRFEGRDRLEFHLKTVLSKRRNHIFSIISVHEASDSDTVIVEAAGDSEVPETGRPYNQRYVVFFTFRNDRICHLKEYFNPLVFQKAFNGFLVGEGAVHN